MAARRPRMADRLEEEVAAPAASNGQAKTGRDVFSQAAVEVGGAGVPFEVPVELIDPAPDNPRERIDLDSPGMKELIASVKELGVLQPVSLIPRGGRYALVFGHRRLAASIAAGRPTIPSIFSGDHDDVGRQIRMLVENTHREDLSPVEEGRSYALLLKLRAAKSQQALAKMLGKPQARVSKRMSLLRLPDEVQAKIGLPESEGGISITAAEELAKLADEPERVVRAVEQAKYAGGIDGAIRREAEAKRNEDEEAALRARLRTEGLSILEGVRPNQEDGPWALDRMPWIDADEHVKGNCHAVMLEGWNRLRVRAYCVNPGAHPEPGGEERVAEADRLAEERAALEEARLAAQSRRWKFAGGLVGKGSADAGAGLVMWMLTRTRGHQYVMLDVELVADVLGLSAVTDTFSGKGPGEAVQAFAGKGTRNAQRAVYATAVVLGEQACAARHASDYDVRVRQRAYLRHLEAAGYELADVERELLAEAEREIYEDDADDEVEEEDQ